MTVNSSYPDTYPPAEVNGCTTKTTINDVQLKDNTQLSVVKQVNIKEFFSGNIKESFLNDFVSEFNFNTLKTFSFPNSENLYCSDDILINICKFAGENSFCHLIINILKNMEHHKKN